MASFTEFFTRLCSSTPIRSQTDLARHLHVNRSAVTQAKERGAVPERWVYKLARDFSLDPSWLGGESQDPDHGMFSAGEYLPVPLAEPRLSENGELVPADSGQDPAPYAFRSGWLRDKGSAHSMVLLRAVGNAMEPTIPSGAHVLIDQEQKEIISGRIYALGIDHSILIRRVERHPDLFMLISPNPDYPPVYVSKTTHLVHVLGAIVWVGTELP
ncbi:S24 family peptidase [Desulfovermiculus halophilus]|uniref:S24 family peptidase n=1 Tax=Desulfovermiculus halophilus TaxID=339722 RepID=UPI0004899C3E|nr:S24 family peptidase [Desulfovermiculus halophilus]